MECPVPLVHVIHVLTLVIRPRPCVVTTAEGDPARLGTRALHEVDLRATGTVRGKVNALVGIVPGRLGVDGPVVGQLGGFPAGQVHLVDFRIAVTGQGHQQGLAVFRPGRGRVQAGEIRYLVPLSGRQLVHVDGWLASFERHIGQLLAVRRPGRGQNRLTAFQPDFCPLAVHVTDLEPVTHLVVLTAHRHIGELGGEHARLSGNGFVNAVADVMRQGADAANTGSCGLTQDPLLLVYIKQFIAGLNPVATAGQFAYQHIALAEHAPVPEVHIRTLRWQAQHFRGFKRAELTAHGEVALYDTAHLVARRHGAAFGKRHNRHRNGRVRPFGYPDQQLGAGVTCRQHHRCQPAGQEHFHGCFMATRFLCHISPWPHRRRCGLNSIVNWRKYRSKVSLSSGTG